MDSRFTPSRSYSTSCIDSSVTERSWTVCNRGNGLVKSPNGQEFLQLSISPSMTRCVTAESGSSLTSSSSFWPINSSGSKSGHRRGAAAVKKSVFNNGRGGCEGVSQHWWRMFRRIFPRETVSIVK